MYVPESSRWLISRGRNTEALDILRYAASVNGNDSEAIFPSWCILKDEPEERSSFLELLKVRACVFRFVSIFCFSQVFEYCASCIR